MKTNTDSYRFSRKRPGANGTLTKKTKLHGRLKDLSKKGVYPQQNHVLLVLEKYPLLKARGCDKVKNKVINKIKSLRKTTS